MNPSIDLSTMKPGETIVRRGQKFTLAEIEPYTNRRGEASAVLHIFSRCVRCGEPYIFKTWRRPNWLPPGCPLHRGRKPPR